MIDNRLKSQLLDSYIERIDHYTEKYSRKPNKLLLKLAAFGIKNIFFNNFALAEYRNISDGELHIAHTTRSNLKTIQHILVIKGDHIGDLIIALPAFLRLRDSFPDASFSLACSPWNVDMARQLGLFDNIYSTILDSNGTPRRRLSREQIELSIETIQKIPHSDIAIILKPESTNNYLADYLDADIIAGFGIDEVPNRTTISHPSRLQSERAEGRVLHTAELLRSLVDKVILHIDLCNTYGGEYLSRIMPPLKNTSDSENIFIGLNFGAGAETKCWPNENYIALIEKLLDTHPNVYVKIFGAPGDVEKSRHIIESCGNRPRIIDLSGKYNLIEFSSSLKDCSVFIGNDTGTTHIAAQICPTLCIYSGTSTVKRFEPLGPQVVTINYEVPCSPCGLNYLAKCQHNHYCMTSISADTVYSEVFKILQPTLLNVSGDQRDEA